jgi:hypothetical protein
MTIHELVFYIRNTRERLLRELKDPCFRQQYALAFASFGGKNLQTVTVTCA